MKPASRYSSDVQNPILAVKTGYGAGQFEADVAFKSVIVYDGIAAGKRAVRILAEAVKGGDAEEDFFPRLWSFSLIADQMWAEMAAKEAIDADVVVISADEPLSKSVLAWVETVIEEKRGVEGAIVISRNHASETKADDPAWETIEQAALRASLAFFDSWPSGQIYRMPEKPVWAVCSE
jgi:hypothetical protein